MTPDYAHELTVALEAAALASDYLRREYAAFTALASAPSDISTHADKGAQEIILRHLQAVFPADGLLAEEATDALRDHAAGASGRVWVVDPIDGTRGFATKNDQFSVMIGLAVADRAVLGVVAEPVPNSTTYGVVGGRCWVRHGHGEAVECRVSLTDSLAAACLARSFGKPGDQTRGERRLQPRTTMPTHSSGIKMALVARGEADVYVNDHSAFCDWDVCAGQALVEAAGGRVTSFDGTPVGYGPGGPRRTTGLIASNGRIHDAAVAALAGG